MREARNSLASLAFLALIAFLAPICMYQSRGKTGGPDLPPEKNKSIGFFSNTGPDPLEYDKATKPAFIVGL